MDRYAIIIAALYLTQKTMYVIMIGIFFLQLQQSQSSQLDSDKQTDYNDKSQL